MNTILLVDDSPTIRKMVQASLAGLDDVAFTEASTGLEAIESLAISSVCLVVLDLNMPDMHGLDVLKFVRSHNHYKDLPVVVLTTRRDPTSRDAAMRAGASAYLTKPFTPSALATIVSEALSSAPLHQPLSRSSPI